jgi:hypothetical protein
VKLEILKSDFFSEADDLPMVETSLEDESKENLQMVVKVEETVVKPEAGSFAESDLEQCQGKSKILLLKPNTLLVATRRITAAYRLHKLTVNVRNKEKNFWVLYLVMLQSVVALWVLIPLLNGIWVAAHKACKPGKWAIP